MEEGKVVLTTKEYMELIERANINTLVMNELLRNKQEIEQMNNRLYEFERKLSYIERK